MDEQNVLISLGKEKSSRQREQHVLKEYFAYVKLQLFYLWALVIESKWQKISLKSRLGLNYEVNF